MSILDPIQNVLTDNGYDNYGIYRFGISVIDNISGQGGTQLATDGGYSNTGVWLNGFNQANAATVPNLVNNPSGIAAGVDTDIQFNDSGKFGGDSNLTWIRDPRGNAVGRLTVNNQIQIGDPTEVGLSNPAIKISDAASGNGTNFEIRGSNSTSAHRAGQIKIDAGDLSGGGLGSFITLSGAQNNGDGGNAILEGGDAVSSNGNGGNVSLFSGAGVGAAQKSGDIILNLNVSSGGGTNGKLIVYPKGSSTIGGILNFDSISSASKTYTYQDKSAVLTLQTTAISGLTNTRIPFSDSLGLLTDSSNLTFSIRTVTTVGVYATTVSAAGVRFRGSTSGRVTIQAQASAGTWTLQLPTTGGTNGYFLQTNGSGVTTWAASSGSGTGILSAPISLAINGPVTTTYADTFTFNQGNESAIGNIMTGTHTIKNLAIGFSQNTIDTGTIVFTIRKNGADTAVTCTANAGDTSVVSDITHSFSVALGDKVDVKAVSGGTSGEADWGFSYDVM